MAEPGPGRDTSAAAAALEGIPEAHLAAVRRYLASAFAIVDPALRQLDEAQMAQLDGFIRAVTHGLFRLPSFRGAVFRGAQLSRDALAHYIPGTWVFEHSFVVATANPALRFPGNTTFVIGSINGRDVSALAQSADAANSADNEEVMFFTGTRFKVLATDHDDARDQSTIYLVEVPDPGLLRG